MSIRNRIFLVFALVALAAGWGLIDWMSSEMRPRYMEAQEDLMVDMGQVLAQQIERHGLVRREGGWQPDPHWLARAYAELDARRFEAQIYGLLKQGIDVRIYVTDASGTVLFDSDGARDTGRNNADWRDIRLSLAGEYGARTTVGDPMFAEGATMYVSTPIRRDGDIVGAVSLGKPTRNAERFRAAAIERFGQAGVVALLAGLLIALGLYRWVSRPLQRLENYAHDLSAGRRVPPPVLGDNEIGRVGQAMTELKNALDGKQYVEHYVQALTHELKSPTAAIAGAAELLGEDVPPADRERFLRNIRHESARLQSLIERMLELAEIENREALDERERLSVAALIRDAVDSLAPLLQGRQIAVDIACDETLTLAGDRLLLQRALVNLLSNAAEFSPPGGRIRIGVEAQPGMLRLGVRDQGPGIPGYARDRVFQRFYSLPRADGRKGTGLGLSFVREIAALHGGRVRLNAAPEGGTEAVLELPG